MQCADEPLSQWQRDLANWLDGIARARAPGGIVPVGTLVRQEEAVTPLQEPGEAFEGAAEPGLCEWSAGGLNNGVVVFRERTSSFVVWPDGDENQRAGMWILTSELSPSS